MIENKHQYELTRQLLERFKNTLLSTNEFHNKNYLLSGIYKRSLIYQIKIFKEELKSYETS